LVFLIERVVVVLIILEDSLVGMTAEKIDAGEGLYKEVVEDPVAIVVNVFVVEVVLLVVDVVVKARVVVKIVLDVIGTTNSDVVVFIKVELKLTLFSSFRSNSILLCPRS